MPTKKKRIGFIPREDVMRIINKLSFENNLSNSKIISILVEEALAKRGIYNIKKSNDVSGSNTLKNKNNLFSNSFNEEESLRNITQTDDNAFFNKIIKNKNHDESFDFLTYEKFLKFLKFQEMIKKYDN